jgi:hypothetical protein
MLPLSSAAALPETLYAFQHQLLQPRSLAAPANPATILGSCSLNAPMAEHATNVLGDICASLRELARAATSTQGQEALRQWLGAPAEDVIGFWLNEYIAE